MRAALAGLALLFAGAAGASSTSSLPPLPKHWPATLQLGTTDEPGGAAALRAVAPFGFRYQYLAGGVNTGDGWSTWNPNGSFVTMYDRDSFAHGIVPVFSYYMLLQSKPVGDDEAKVDLSHLVSAELMKTYWADLTLFFKRARAPKPVVLHMEPDLWGYVEQAAKGDDAATVPAVVPEGPQNAAGFAQEVVRLRNRYAPNVILAYHMSGWGTRHDIVYEDPPDATVASYAARSARFFRSLHARFDVSFEDFSDRDAGFYAKQQGNPRTWFKPADFHRHLLYAQTFVRLAGLRMVAWQIPLGNTKMRSVDNIWDHFQDNRVQWLLDDATRAHLQAYANAGVIAFLFGRGADGATCACDAAHDGITNPAPIDGNAGRSLSADDDGGFFKARAAAYYRRGAIPLPR